MPISAQMSLWGINQYDPTVLDGLKLPVGMNYDTVKANLLLETASMEILYPDPAFLKNAISVWSDERIDVWQKLYNTTVLTYDPIENYNRMEESNTDDTLGSKNTSKTTTKDDGSSSSSGNNTVTNSSTAYNSNDFADVNKSLSSGSNLTTNTGSGSADTTSDTTSTGNRKFNSRIHGNIGVTTSQQMIESEREVSLFCMTQFIIDDFISRFCVGVY